MARGVSARDRKKETWWRRHVKAQATSGLSVAAYCRQAGVPAHGLYWWRREAAGGSARNAAASAFVPVSVAAEAPVRAAAGRIEIVLAGGFRVRVLGAVDRALLGEVLAVVQEHRRDVQREGRSC